MKKHENLYKLTARFQNLSSFTYLIRHANQKDTKVINFQDFKKKKQTEEYNKKWGLASLFDLMDPHVLFGENSHINVDDMHRAREAAGFPPIPQGAPPWMYMVISAIDEPDPAKRKARFTRLSHWLSRATKDPEAKKQADEDYEKEKAEEVRQFIMAAKQGWLKFSNIEKWADNYPLLFSNLEYRMNDWTDEAKDYLIRRNEVLKARERRQSVVPPDTNVASLPIGTTLHFAKPFQKLYVQWTAKRDEDEWISNENTVGSDAFIIDRLKSNQDRTFPMLLWKPDESFDSSGYVPSEKEINDTIERYLKEKPEKFLEGLWKYDAGSTYTDSDDEIDE
jgi:hypothetical protein